MPEISSDSEVNDLRKRIVMDEPVTDDEIRDAIAYMRAQRSENGKGSRSQSTNRKNVNLDDLL